MESFFRYVQEHAPFVTGAAALVNLIRLIVTSRKRPPGTSRTTERQRQVKIELGLFSFESRNTESVTTKS